MQASFDSQYSTVDSLAYNIADRMDDSRNTANVCKQFEGFIRSHSSDRLPKSVLLKALKNQIKTLFEQQYKHDLSSSRNRRQTQPMRQQPQQQVILLYERDANHTRLEVYDPKRMTGQAELRRSQSQSINHHSSPLSSSRVQQPRQPPQAALFQPHQQVNRSMKQERPIQINAQSHPETKMKRISSKTYWKRFNDPLVTPHAIYNQKSSEAVKEEEPVYFQHQKSSNGQHFWENRRNTLTSEEILRFNSRNKSAQRR